MHVTPSLTDRTRLRALSRKTLSSKRTTTYVNLSTLKCTKQCLTETTTTSVTLRTTFLNHMDQSTHFLFHLIFYTWEGPDKSTVPQNSVMQVNRHSCRCDYIKIYKAMLNFKNYSLSLKIQFRKTSIIFRKTIVNGMDQSVHVM